MWEKDILPSLHIFLKYDPDNVSANLTGFIPKPNDINAKELANDDEFNVIKENNTTVQNPAVV